MEPSIPSLRRARLDTGLRCYTGRQVWNRQRKDEVLLDVHDVALGHTTVMRWNDPDKWIFSEQIVHPQIVDDETWLSLLPVPRYRAHPPGTARGRVVRVVRLGRVEGAVGLLQEREAGVPSSYASSGSGPVATPTAIWR